MIIDSLNHSNHLNLTLAFQFSPSQVHLTNTSRSTTNCSVRRPNRWKLGVELKFPWTIARQFIDERHFAHHCDDGDSCGCRTTTHRQPTDCCRSGAGWGRWCRPADGHRSGVGGHEGGQIRRRSARYVELGVVANGSAADDLLFGCRWQHRQCVHDLVGDDRGSSEEGWLVSDWNVLLNSISLIWWWPMFSMLSDSKRIRLKAFRIGIFNRLTRKIHAPKVF